jgi:DHA1 family multidrug resistance protein-like MFS transporter
MIASANFLSGTIMSPVWGNLADRHGRKLMVLRSSVALAVCTTLMSFVTSVYQLLLVRFLQGAFCGFNSAAIALIVTTTPQSELGYALAVFQSSQLAGTVFGPILGGLLGGEGGYRQVFLLTGAINVLASIVVIFGVREDFKAPVLTKKQQALSIKSTLTFLRDPLFLAIFMVFFFSQFSMRIVEPILTLFVKSIYTQERYLSLVVGAIFAATGLANVIFSPLIGKYTDKVGSQRVLTNCLTTAGGLYMLHTLVNSPWTLLLLRFALGICLAGILPAANALVVSIVPIEKRGSAFGLMASASFLGSFAGPLTGGSISAIFGVRWLFPVTAVLLWVNAVWVRWKLTPKGGGTL